MTKAHAILAITCFSCAAFGAQEPSRVKELSEKWNNWVARSKVLPYPKER